MYQERLKRFDEIISICEGIERKGKTMPYSSSNSRMFCLLNKAGEIGVRLSKEAQTKYKESIGAEIFHSYGAVMKDYIKIPEDHLGNDALMKQIFEEGLQFIQSLAPKK